MKIGLLGHGVVGSGVRKIIDDSLTEETKQLEVVRILVKDESEITDPSRMTTVADEVLNDPEIDVVVECMGGIEPARTFALQAMKNGKHFVTSNKKMLASCLEELFDCAKENNVTLHYEASCGGGIPWMANLDRTKRIDSIDSFRGIFNGTTNYILSNMFSEGKDFEEMLKNAQQLGYAEKDPTDDIDGYDVRYKVALSCVKAFEKCVKPEDISMYGIRHITTSDINYAKENGYVIKMIGKGNLVGDTLQANVMPVFVKKDDAFASIPLNFNAIESDSRTLGKAVYIGQGAGSLPTAHAVVQDIIDILKNENSTIPAVEESKVDSSYESVFFIRCHDISVFEEVISQKVSDEVIITKKLSLNELNDLIGKSSDDSLFVGEIQE